MEQPIPFFFAEIIALAEKTNIVKIDRKPKIAKIVNRGSFGHTPIKLSKLSKSGTPTNDSDNRLEKEIFRGNLLRRKSRHVVRAHRVLVRNLIPASCALCLRSNRCPRFSTMNFSCCSIPNRRIAIALRIAIPVPSPTPSVAFL